MAEQVWKKGALHTHTYWSDGRGFPEQMVKAYRDLEFDFACFTDHNVYSEDPLLWQQVFPEEGAWPCVISQERYDDYKNNFSDSIEEKTYSFKTYVRVKPFAEVAESMSEKGRFVLIGGAEFTGSITGRLGFAHVMHAIYLNVKKTFPYLSGDDAAQTLALNYEQYRRVAQSQQESSLFMLCHPFWRFMDVEPLALIDANQEVTLFEICNSIFDFCAPANVYSLEKFWDIVNAFRLDGGKSSILYATASDDSHFYDAERSNAFGSCGHAWVMVNNPGEFNTESLIEAMNRGDFYPTTGVELERINFDRTSGTLGVKVKAEPGVKYRISFITTKRGFDKTTTEIEIPEDGKRPRRLLKGYSDEIGRIVLETAGVEAEYTMACDDLYIRAEVVSDVPSFKTGPGFPTFNKAWTQPFKR